MPVSHQTVLVGDFNPRLERETRTQEGGPYEDSVVFGSPPDSPGMLLQLLIFCMENQCKKLQLFLYLLFLCGFFIFIF